jgi:hypothetical protein
MNLSNLRKSPWAIPALLGIGSSFALIAALAAEGVWDFVSWTLLSLPLLVVGLSLRRK